LADDAAYQLYLEQLPAYAPELHPREGLWLDSPEKGRSAPCVASICRIYVANSEMPLNESVKVFSEAHNFSDLCWLFRSLSEAAAHAGERLMTHEST
jgi:hypothetical protein